MNSQPEPQNNSEQKAEVPTQSHTIAKPHVGSSTTSHTAENVFEGVCVEPTEEEWQAVLQRRSAFKAKSPEPNVRIK